MGESERFSTTVRPNVRRVARTNPSVVNNTLESQSRRLTEPLDESGAPLIPEPKPGRNEADSQLEDRIRVRAYERYLERQGRPGTPETDWMEAEREVRGSVWSSRDRSTPAI